MDTIQSDLNKFLIFAAKKGYANPRVQKISQLDGSETIAIKQEEFNFNDNYFTSQDGRRFHGREIVFYKDIPYWFLAYSGFVDKNQKPREVYQFLKDAMLNPLPNFPVRGPKKYQDRNWTYELDDLRGDLSDFTATEYISKDNKRVYKCNIIGGMIN